MRAAALELAPVRVNAVAPGVVRRELWASLPESDREGLFSAVGAALPAGRVGEVADVADAIVFLLANPWTTGTVLTVDGGTVLV